MIQLCSGTDKKWNFNVLSTFISFHNLLTVSFIFAIAIHYSGPVITKAKMNFSRLVAKVFVVQHKVSVPCRLEILGNRHEKIMNHNKHFMARKEGSIFGFLNNGHCDVFQGK